MNTITRATRIRGLIATAIFSALALSFAAVCAADDSTNPPSATVKYGDLNLSNPQGAAALYSRIVGAAHEVCRSFEIDSRNPMFVQALNACVHKAIADAVTKVGQPELFAIYNAKNRQPLPMTVAQTR